MSALNYGAVLQSLLSSLAPPSRAQLANPMAAQMAANKANSQRGQSILQLLSEQGNTSMADNQTAFQNQEADIDQSMMDKGLANTTVGDNLKQGAVNNLALNNNRVRESTSDAIARMAASFSQPAGGMPQAQNNGPEMAGRIISGPDTGFNFRSFGG